MQRIFKAKIFKNGGSQAIRIPSQMRFDSDEVFLRYDEAVGGIVITERNPKSLERFFALVQEYGPVPEAEWPNNWREYPEAKPVWLEDWLQDEK